MFWGILGVNINLHHYLSILVFTTMSMRADACWRGTSPGSLWNLRPCSQISVSSGFAVKVNVMPQTFIEGSFKVELVTLKNPTRAKIPCRIVSKVCFFFARSVWMYLVCHSWLAQMGLCHFQSWNSRN